MPVDFEFDSEKAIAVLAYLASKTDEIPDLDKYKAGKLVFLADKYHLVRYGRPIVGGEYRALEYGPVPQTALDLLQAAVEEIPLVRNPTAQRLRELLDVDRSFRYPRIHAKEVVLLESLSRSDLMALDYVVANFGGKSFNDLKAITHGMSAYRKAWESRGSANMAPMAYEDFFDEEPDAVAGALEETQENDELKRAFPGDVGF